MRFARTLNRTSPPWLCWPCNRLAHVLKYYRCAGFGSALPAELLQFLQHQGLRKVLTENKLNKELNSAVQALNRWRLSQGEGVPELLSIDGKVIANNLATLVSLVDAADGSPLTQAAAPGNGQERLPRVRRNTSIRRFDRSLADPDLERSRFFIQVFPGQLSGGSPFQLPAQRYGIVVVSNGEGFASRKIFPGFEDQLMPDRARKFTEIERE